MASITIETVPRVKGTAYKTRMRIFKNGQLASSISRTFESLAQARSYADRLRKADNDDRIGSLFPIKKRYEAVGDVLNRYLNHPVVLENLSPSKRSNLEMLLGCPIAQIPLEGFIAKNLLDHCDFRQQIAFNALSPATLALDISNLSSAMKDSSVLFGIKVNIGAFSEARTFLHRYGIIGRSEERTRRPSAAELKIIKTALKERDSHENSTVPMVDISNFAVESSARLGEFCGKKGITWGDWNETERTLTIRNRKDPRPIKGKTSIIPLSSKAMEIIAKQPREGKNDPIFPYKPSSVSSAWRNTMKKLNIEDLHFHDLRAEGACRLFESGKNIVEISKVTGHRDLNILNNFYLRLGLTDKSLLAA